MEKKKTTEKAISNSGIRVFDGNLTLTIAGKQYKTRCEYHGLDLQRASQEHQVVMLIKDHLPYNEADTGWVVRTKEMDKAHQFGLKPTKTSKVWSVYEYGDVIAWGYADGGLNNSHFNSCRLRPEEEPAEEEIIEEEYEPDWEEFDMPTNRRCVRLKMNEDGTIQYHAIVSSEEKKERGGTELMHACAAAFDELRKKHPEVTEMHFYTDQQMAVE